MGTPTATSMIDPPAGDRPTASAVSLRWWQGALAGLVAAGAALGVAQLVSGLLLEGAPLPRRVEVEGVDEEAGER